MVGAQTRHSFSEKATRVQGKDRCFFFFRNKVVRWLVLMCYPALSSRLYSNLYFSNKFGTRIVTVFFSIFLSPREVGRAGIGKYPPHFQWQRTKQKEIAEGNKFKPKLESSNEKSEVFKVRKGSVAPNSNLIWLARCSRVSRHSSQIPPTQHSSKQWQRAPTCRRAAGEGQALGRRRRCHADAEELPPSPTSGPDPSKARRSPESS